MPNLGQNRRFLEPCDLEIWRMTLKNNRAHLLCYFKLCASFRSHWWIQTGVTVRKRPIWVNFNNFFSRVTLKFDGWPWKTIELYDLKIWRVTLRNNRAHLLCYFKLCTSFRSHWWIQTGVTVRKRPIWVNFNNFFSRVTLKFDGWPWKTIELYDLKIWRVTLRNNRAHLLCYFKLCASFYSHWWIQTGVTVRKRPIWVKFDDF